MKLPKRSEDFELEKSGIERVLTGQNRILTQKDVGLSARVKN